MRRDDFQVIYWDTSAILSALFKDRHSDEAQRWAHREGIHLVSTLAYAETCAVIARMQREHLLADLLIKAALEVLEGGPWHRLSAWPEWKIIQTLSVKWPVRGADLWHLAMAKSLQKQLPELFLLTFDTQLQAAAQGEGMVSAW
ncbi:MAG TPA: PIN domain-containing protein [Syntrophaceae bacterium]|nr:PIN domain-containing protein [Syntrophaceae bacterium]